MKKHLFFTAVYCSVLTASFEQSWNLTGNSSINSNTNFLGTTDGKPLVFKTNNTERMRIAAGGKIGIGTSNPFQKLDVNGNINLGKGFSINIENHPVFRVDSAGGNIFLGNGAGFKNASSFNTATGFQALSSTTSGGNNTANGYRALYSNNAGYENTASGAMSLYSNTTGFQNAAFGYHALFFNSTGSYNAAAGYYALFSNSTGNGNAAFGYGALSSNTNGNDNVAVGTRALANSSSGMYNTAIGSAALFSDFGSYNTAVGYIALFHNASGHDNTAQGVGALYSNTTGIGNTAQGMNALYSNTYGQYNTAVGYYALYNTYTSQGNTAVGESAGAGFSNGYYNTFIGSHADATAADIYNSTALGSTSLVTAPGQVRIGNSYVTSIGGYAGWSNISDGRVKKNIQENVPGLAFINKLKPVTYNLDLDAADKIVRRPSVKGKAGPEDAAGQGELLTQQPSQLELNGRTTKQQVIYTGFVAQDVEKAAKELDFDFSGVDAPKNDKDLYALRYAEFVVPVVKAVQELSAKNDDLQKQVDELKAIIASGKQDATSTQSKIIAIDNVSIKQNVPNPFNNSTVISYTLPQQYSSAKIVVSDKLGKPIKAINISGSGNGKVTVGASSLSMGSYQYSLYVDGRLIETKQMVHIK